MNTATLYKNGVLFNWTSGLVRHALVSRVLDTILDACPIGMERVTVQGKTWNEYPVYARLQFGVIRKSLSAVLACTCKQLHNILVLRVNPFGLTRHDKNECMVRHSELTGATLVRGSRTKEYAFEIDCDSDSDMSEDLYDY